MFSVYLRDLQVVEDSFGIFYALAVYETPNSLNLEETKSDWFKGMSTCLRD